LLLFTGGNFVGDYYPAGDSEIELVPPNIEDLGPPYRALA